MLDVFLEVSMRFIFVIGTAIAIILLLTSMTDIGRQTKFYLDFIGLIKTENRFALIFWSYISALCILFWLPKIIVDVFYRPRQGGCDHEQESQEAKKAVPDEPCDTEEKPDTEK